MTVHRVALWNDFKTHVQALDPDTVFYLAEPHPLRRPPLGLRLTFYHGQDMYVFTDYADAANLHKTGIPLAGLDTQNRAELKEEDIKRFLSKELGSVKLASLPPFIY